VAARQQADHQPVEQGLLADDDLLEMPAQGEEFGLCLQGSAPWLVLSA
jgi:hypothetical protein